MAYQAPVLGRVDGTDTTTTTTIAHASGLPPAPDADRFVLPRSLRYVVVVLIAVSVPLIAGVFWEPRPVHEYLQTMVLVHLGFIVPTLLLAALAALRSPSKDRVVRWIWTVGIALGVIAVIRAYLRISPEMQPTMLASLVPVFVVLGLLLVANTLMLRARSGERAALVDAIDLIMATMALTVPLWLAFGDTLINSPVPWFSVNAGMWVVVACHATLVVLVIRTRTQPDHRLMANIGLGFAITVMVSSVAQVVLGIGDFTLPSGPFLALFAASLSGGVLFFAFSTREASPGLERLPLGGQVRRSSAIALLVMASIPVTGAVVWWQRDVSWVPTATLVAGLVLLALSSARHLLAGREAMRLHDLVEESAAERSQLLSEVLAHIDLDRHRAASHLHRQAASLYTAMASFSSAVGHGDESSQPASVGYAADRLRRDLGHRADNLRRIAEAIKPIEPAGAEARSLAVPMRAYLENLCGDGPRPDLTVDIDPELALDWTTEAVVLRIAQEATLNALWRARATAVHISVTADSEGIHLEIADDGGCDQPAGHDLTTLQSMARFMGGDLSIIAEPTAGRVISATIPFVMRVPDEPRSHLRVVDDS